MPASNTNSRRSGPRESGNNILQAATQPGLEREFLHLAGARLGRRFVRFNRTAGNFPTRLVGRFDQQSPTEIIVNQAAGTHWFGYKLESHRINLKLAG
jgi:hypothetical protein